MQYKVGDRIEVTNLISGGDFAKGLKIGQQFEVLSVDMDGDVRVEFSQSRSYLLTKNQIKLVSASNKTSFMKTLGTMFKKLVDADTQALVKAGYINGDLELTDEGKNELMALVFDANKAALVVAAQAKLTQKES
jgi:hypothetical protein